LAAEPGQTNPPFDSNPPPRPPALPPNGGPAANGNPAGGRGAIFAAADRSGRQVECRVRTLDYQQRPRKENRRVWWIVSTAVAALILAGLIVPAIQRSDIGYVRTRPSMPIRRSGIFDTNGMLPTTQQASQVP
jgi:hypothetical protein